MAGSPALPELRRVVYRPAPLAGRPLWVEDPAFRIERHVDAAEAAAAGADERRSVARRDGWWPSRCRSRPAAVADVVPDRAWQGGRVGVLVDRSTTRWPTAMTAMRHGPRAARSRRSGARARMNRPRRRRRRSRGAVPRGARCVVDNVGLDGREPGSGSLRPVDVATPGALGRALRVVGRLGRATGVAIIAERARSGPQAPALSCRLDRLEARRVARSHGVRCQRRGPRASSTGGVRALLDGSGRGHRPGSGHARGWPSALFSAARCVARSATTSARSTCRCRSASRTQAPACRRSPRRGPRRSRSPLVAVEPVLRAWARAVRVRAALAGAAAARQPRRDLPPGPGRPGSRSSGAPVAGPGPDRAPGREPRPLVRRPLVRRAPRDHRAGGRRAVPGPRRAGERDGPGLAGPGPSGPDAHAAPTRVAA